MSNNLVWTSGTGTSSAVYPATNLGLPTDWDSVEYKLGARHSRSDDEAIQAAHDYLCKAGAKCNTESKSVDDTMIFYGGEVKALGDGRVGGYLVRYSTENDPDLTGDFFTPDTFIDERPNLKVYYHHGLDPVLGKRIIGEAKSRKDNVGLWVEAQLAMRDDYERKIYELAQAGKLGWSSGSAGHLVDRVPVGHANKVVSWPIAEASLTPTPAEPRNSAISLKSLLSRQSMPESGSTASAKPRRVKSHKD